MIVMIQAPEWKPIEPELVVVLLAINIIGRNRTSKILLNFEIFSIDG